MASSLVGVPRPRRWAQLGRRAVLCGDSSLIRACLCRRRRGSWGLYALRRQERCHGVSSQNACGRSPVARGRRKGPWQTAVIRPRRSRPYTCDPTAERGSRGWTVFHLPSTPDGKLSTVPPRLRPAGAIDGSHAALTSTASYLGREAVRDVFPSAGEKAAPPFCFVVDRGRRRGTTVRRARPPPARAPASSCTSVCSLVAVLARMDAFNARLALRRVLRTVSHRSPSQPRKKQTWPPMPLYPPRRPPARFLAQARFYVPAGSRRASIEHLPAVSLTSCRARAAGLQDAG